MTWGACDAKSAQGWMQANPYFPGYWTASWSGTHNTHERDGKVVFKNNVWVSETGKNISYPYAVIDDFGFLVPVHLVISLQTKDH